MSTPRFPAAPPRRRAGGATLSLSLALLACAALAPSALAAPTKSPAAAGGGGLYGQLVKRYGALKSYQATVTLLTVLQPLNGSQPNRIDATLNVAYRAPNLLRIDTQGLLGGGETVSDGKMLYTYSALTNQYSAAPAPRAPLTTLLGNLREAGSLRASGRTVIDGAPANEYTGVSVGARGKSTYQVYVDAKSGLLRRVVIRVPQIASPQGARFQVTSTQEFVTQKLNPVLQANLFTFTPPSGAQRGNGPGPNAILGGLGGFNP